MAHHDQRLDDLAALYIEAGSEPPWARCFRDGQDITEQPGLWTDADRERRADWEARVDRLGLS